MEKDLIEYIAKSLVSDPESVRVEENQNEKGRVLELHVAQYDIGKVIGRHGRIAKAIRTVLNAAIAGSGNRAILEIMD